MTVEELKDELVHLDKEIKLLNYEVVNSCVTGDTFDRLDKLMKRYLYLRSIAILYGLQ